MIYSARATKLATKQAHPEGAGADILADTAESMYATSKVAEDSRKARIAMLQDVAGRLAM